MTDSGRNPGDQAVLDAMRSGEWLRTQWIARVVYDMGAAPWEPEKGARVRRILVRLQADGTVECRRGAEHRAVGEIPRDEWRLRR